MGDSGLLRLTFVQVSFNKSTDFVDFNATNPDGSKDVYAMYANYYVSTVTPEEEVAPDTGKTSCVLSSSTNTIKTGGSYKTVTATFYDSTGADITESYFSKLSLNSWKFSIDDVEIGSELITVVEQSVPNKIKVKFAKNLDYLTKILVIQCSVDDIVGDLSLEVTNL